MKASSKSFGYFIICLKSLLGILLVWIFYQQLQSVNLISLHAIPWSDTFYIFLGTAMLLMPLNWFLEAIKWKFMLPASTSISWRIGLMQIFKGITLGIMTPGRVGDYGGRLIHLGTSNHIHALAATFAGSVAQNIIQILTGSVCIYLFMDRFTLLDSDLLIMWTILAAGVMGLFGILFFYPKYILGWISGMESLKKYAWIRQLELSVNFSVGKLFSLLGLAFLRYLIYAVQYIFIMMSLNVEMNLIDMMQAVGVIYFFQSLLPLPPILNWLGRGEIAVLVLGQFQVAAISALICTYLLWLVNLGLPALLGYILILRGSLNLKNAEIRTDGDIPK